MEHPQKPALQIKPHFSRATKQWVIDSARDAHGDVICACCTTPIHDDQQVTINHKLQWQVIKAGFSRDHDFEQMPHHLQRRLIQNAYNKAGNLEPLHVACHLLVDEGIELSAEETELRNRKLTGRKEKAFPKYPEFFEEILETPAVKSKSGKKRKPNQVTTKEMPLSMVETIDYRGTLFGRVLLSDQPLKLMLVAPADIRAEYLELSRERLLHTENQLRNVLSRVPNSGKERTARDKSYDGLVGQKLGLMGQIEQLEHYSNRTR